MKDNYKRRAVVTDVVDGDTFWAAVDLGFGVVFNVKIRMAGIDTKELHDKKNEKKALAAKKYLQEKVEGKEVTLKSLKPGKYSRRYIGFLYFDDERESVNDKMIKLGLAVPYNGGKRTSEKPDASKNK